MNRNITPLRGPSTVRRRTKSLWLVAAAAMAATTVVTTAPHTSRASAETIMSCPDGSVAVEFGFGAPPVTGPTTTGSITAQRRSGLLCQQVFLADGTFTKPTDVGTVDVLVVGGGGGGALGGVFGDQINTGGGGAGGQVALYEGVPISGDVTVSVGAGGAGGVDPCPATVCSTTGGIDGGDGEASEFGTDGTYLAGGGDGGVAGSTTAASPYLAAGTGGGSPSSLLMSPTPPTVTATVSDGGAGGDGVGDLMGPSPAWFFSAAGGGAGAGGDGVDATSGPTCIVANGSTSCYLDGGDGGLGFIPDSGDFDYFYWESWFPMWSQSELGLYTDPNVTGFGPGGGGATAGNWLTASSGYLDFPGTGHGRNLDGGNTYIDGKGAVTFGNNDESIVPYSAALQGSGADDTWSTFYTAFGGGGGGAIGNPDAGITDTDAVTGSNGVDGIVIVLFRVPIDSDGDGYLSNVDCDDSASTVNPGATELVGNGYDDDCNAETPIGSDTTLSCDFAAVTTNAVANDFLDLNFSGTRDLGGYPAVDDQINYTSVAAIGGPALATGQLSNLSGTSPNWTATLTVSDTTGISVGDGVTARNDVGDLGAGNVVTVSSVDDATTLQVAIDGYTDPVEGDVTTVRTGQLVDAQLTVSDHVTPSNLDIETVDVQDDDGDLNAAISSWLYAYGSLEGTVANVLGDGPWTGEIRDLVSTDGLTIGERFIAGSAYDGWAPGIAGIYTITDIIDSTTIAFSAEGGTAPQEGWISGIHSWTSVEYTIDFFEGGSDFLTPIELNDVSLVVKDVDEYQFVEFARPDSIRLERSSALEVLSGSSSDLVPTNNYRFWSGPDSEVVDTPHWVEVSYDTVSSMKVRMGALSTGGMQFDLAFGQGAFTDPITCGTIIVDEVPTTTTYTGDSGTILEGTSMTLSATVDPDTCTTPAVTYELEYPDTTTATVTSPLDTTGFAPGQYHITASYAGDGTCLPSDDTADFFIPYPTVTTYTGGTGLITAGSSISLSATVTPAECSSPAVTYTVVYPDGTEHPATSPLNTTGFGPGIYEIVTDYAGDDETCLPSEDSALLVIATPGDSTTGGGIYHVDSNISGTPRVHFGFTVQRTSKTDKRSGSTEVIQRGQLLWMNNNEWRLKASLYSRNVTSGGITTGDTPVFGTTPCPVGVGATGSNPKCGIIVGGGWLERWNSDTLEWEVATDLGRNGWVSFSATIYDGGSVKVCKGKTCSIVDVADWFGMSMAGIRSTSGVPVTAPIQVRKQQNGAIVIRV